MDSAKQGILNPKSIGLLVLAMAIGNAIYGFNSHDSTASLGQKPAVQQIEPELQKVQMKSISNKPEQKIHVNENSKRVQYEVQLGDTAWKIASAVKPENVQMQDYVDIFLDLNKNKVLKSGTVLDIPSQKDLKGVTLPNVYVHFDLSDPELLYNIKEAEGSIKSQSSIKRKLINGTYGYPYKNHKFHPYQDSNGNWTIGYGHFLGKSIAKAKKYSTGISVKQANDFLRSDMEYAYEDFVLMLQQKKAVNLPQEVQLALFEMTFNMGSNKVKDFKNMWKSIHKNNYLKASKEMKNSDWAKQVGDRATRIVDLVASSHKSNT